MTNYILYTFLFILRILQLYFFILYTCLHNSHIQQSKEGKGDAIKCGPKRKCKQHLPHIPAIVWKAEYESTQFQTWCFLFFLLSHKSLSTHTHSKASIASSILRPSMQCGIYFNAIYVRYKKQYNPPLGMLCQHHHEFVFSSLVLWPLEISHN